MTNEELIRIIQQAVENQDTYLNLSSNQLTELPPEIGQLTNLTMLALHRNRLTDLPPEIGQLSNLTMLDLSRNQLTELPPEIGQLSNLTSLGLVRNQLTGLPPEIGQLSNLTSLDLRYNQLTELPPEIVRLSNLTRLDLGDNQLTELPPEIGQLSNLTSLVLPYNQLTDLPPEIGQLTNLTSLVLRYNQLTELPPEIGQLTNLTSLYLEGNQLTELSPEIGQLTNLTSLYLEGNQLTELPPEIGQLTNLRRLHLAPNPLRIPPPEIAARGMDDVLDFLRALAEGSAVRREAKMLLVGEGRSGKSSLLRALQGEPFVEGLDTTHGIDVEPYCLPHPNRPGEDVILNVWDFGGQQIYHTTHQFFMTKRSLYVLVWNARGDTDQARLDYWLHNIQVLAPESPVLLVATHIDERPADFNYERFRTAYPQLVGHIGVSNKDGTGIDDLRQIITRRAAELPLMEQQWPITWCDAEEALRGHDGYHITRATYTQICVAQGVRADIAQTVLGGYLHDLGKILYYQDDDLLCDFVILKPNWLTEAISKVLDDDIVRESGGLLPHADFARIWAGYDRSLYPRFLRMMERFLISYQLPSDGPNQEATHSLVPLRLPHNIPPDMRPWPEVLAGQPEINMLFKLQGFTPPGVMSWFIVLTHPYTTGVHWREGVRLEYEGHQAEVVLNPSTHELWLRARGPSPFNFFNILHHTISERVLGFYKGLKYDRLVPCNCHLDQDADTEPCTYLHDYERLAERMEHNKLEVECDRPPFKQVSVPVLLYGIHYTTNDQIVARLDEIHRDVKQGNEGIQDLHIELSQVSELLQRDFTRTWNYHSASLEAECPNTFVLMPGDRKALAPQALLSTGYTLYLMCQHPGGPHIVKGQKGYPVLQSKDWWAKLAPWLNRLTDYLRYIPKARALAEAYDEGIFNDIKTSLDVFQAILKNVPEEFETHDHPKHLSSAGSRFETMEATGPALRLIHSFLKESDPKEHWCGLHKTITRDGNILWLCDEHRKIHQE